MANALATFAGKGKKKLGKDLDIDEDELLLDEGEEQDEDAEGEKEGAEDSDAFGVEDSAFADEDIAPEDAPELDALEDKPAHAALPSLVAQLAEDGELSDDDTDIIDEAKDEELTETSDEVESPEVQQAEELLGTEAHTDEEASVGDAEEAIDAGESPTKAALASAGEVLLDISNDLDNGMDIEDEAFLRIEEALDEIATMALEESKALTDGKAIKEEVAKRKDRGAILARFAKLMG